MKTLRREGKLICFFDHSAPCSACLASGSGGIRFLEQQGNLRGGSSSLLQTVVPHAQVARPSLPLEKEHRSTGNITCRPQFSIKRHAFLLLCLLVAVSPARNRVGRVWLVDLEGNPSNQQEECHHGHKAGWTDKQDMPTNWGTAFHSFGDQLWHSRTASVFLLVSP